MELSEIKCRQEGSPTRGLYNVESEANLVIAPPQNIPAGYHNTHHPGFHHDAPPNTENQRNFLFDISPKMDQLDRTPKNHTAGGNGNPNSGQRKITINKSPHTDLELRRDDSKREIRSRPNSANQQVIKISTGTFNTSSGKGISTWASGGGNRAKSSGQVISNKGSKSNKSKGSRDDGHSNGNQWQNNVNNSPRQESSRNENALQVLREQKKNEMSKYMKEHHKNFQSVQNRINPDGQAQIDDAMNSIVMNHTSSNPNLLAQNNQYPPMMHQSNPNLNSTPYKDGNRQLSRKNSNSGFGSNQKPNFEEVKGKMACQKRDNSAKRSSNGPSNNSSTYNSMKETAKPKRNMIPNQAFFTGSQQYNSQPQAQQQPQEQTMPKNHNQNMRTNNQNHMHQAHTVKQQKAQPQPQATHNPKDKFKNVQSKIRDQIISDRKNFEAQKSSILREVEDMSVSTYEASQQSSAHQNFQRSGQNPDGGNQNKWVHQRMQKNASESNLDPSFQTGGFNCPSEPYNYMENSIGSKAQTGPRNFTKKHSTTSLNNQNGKYFYDTESEIHIGTGPQSGLQNNLAQQNYGRRTNDFDFDNNPNISGIDPDDLVDPNGDPNNH